MCTEVNKRPYRDKSGWRKPSGTVSLVYGPCQWPWSLRASGVRASQNTASLFCPRARPFTNTENSPMGTHLCVLKLAATLAKFCPSLPVDAPRQPTGAGGKEGVGPVADSGGSTVGGVEMRLKENVASRATTGDRRQAADGTDVEGNHTACKWDSLIGSSPRQYLQSRDGHGRDTTHEVRHPDNDSTPRVILI